MFATSLSRRSFFGLSGSAALVAAIPVAVTQPVAAQKAPLGLLKDVEELPESLEKALTFASLMMDAYATGSVRRLTQSYSDQALGPTAFTYDNAVLIHAYLATSDPDNLPRAEILGQGLLYAQANNFPVADGRFAQAYYVNVANPDGSGAFITPAAAPFYFYGSAVGDQAWAGMALAQLFRRTGDHQYLIGAVKVANWIVTNAYSDTGAGGYSFGTVINPQNMSVPSTNGKSTEHNIDTFAFFTMLASLTQEKAVDGRSWQALATHALQFLRQVYNAAGPYFYTGTASDGATVATTPIPEDCQTWSYMALLNRNAGLARHAETIDWAIDNLSVTDTALANDTRLVKNQQGHGLTFDTASLTTSSADPHAVWFEGTAHTAAALISRVLNRDFGGKFAKLASDIQRTLRLLNDCVHGQKLLGVGQTVNGKVIPSGLGLVAASSVLDTGFGYTYGPSLHIGATCWFLIAGYAGNPFQLGYRPAELPI